MTSSDSDETEASVPLASAQGEHGFGWALGRLSEALALVGGAMMLLVVIMTVVSIVGRQLFDMPIKGDYEITELACGIAVFLFFPYTHVSRQNIVAEFFTMKLSKRGQARLEGVHDLIFAGVAAFLAWRIFEGLLDKIASAETTIMLGLPVWWSYVVATVACIVLVLVCLWCAVRFGIGKRA